MKKQGGAESDITSCFYHPVHCGQMALTNTSTHTRQYTHAHTHTHTHARTHPHAHTHKNMADGKASWGYWHLLPHTHMRFPSFSFKQAAQTHTHINVEDQRHRMKHGLLQA